MRAVEELAGTWRSEASMMGRRGMAQAKLMLESVADELEDTLAAHLDEALTMDQAVAESGFTRQKLSKDLREGRIPNAGRSRDPRIRRRDLPRKQIAREDDSPGAALVADILQNKRGAQRDA